MSLRPAAEGTDASERLDIPASFTPRIHPRARGYMSLQREPSGVRGVREALLRLAETGRAASVPGREDEMEQHAVRSALAAGMQSFDDDRPRLRQAADVPLLEASQGGLAEKAESVIHRLYPFVASIATANVLSLLLSGLGILVGLALTKLLLPVGGLEQLDERMPAWLESQRTPSRDDASFVASAIGADVLIVLVSVSILAFAFRRHWRLAGFLLTAILVEVTTYRVVADMVGRDRPDVAHLDQLHPSHSFPSGHVAASIAVYGGLALLVVSRFRGFWLRVIAVSLAVGIPVIVAFSRVYRGEHHPSDILGGMLLGTGSLLIAVFATRTGIVAAERRALKRADGGRR
jgi:membrane-associated phospholipid phosphatase